MTRLARVSEGFSPVRLLALVATLGLVGSFTSVLYGLVDVAGGTGEFGLAVLASLVGATLLASVLRPRHALALAGVVLVAGLAWYMNSLPYTPRVLPILQSNLELLSGQSVHQIRRSGTWALGVVPGPVFVTWYFAMRRWYGAAVLVGGAMLGYLVLTGDATLPITLVGVVGGTAMLAFGDLDRHAGTSVGAEYVAISLAVMVAVPLVVTVVPGGAGSPLSLVEGPDNTLESSLLESSAQFSIQGSIRLSPDVRFTVESDEPRYWKAGSYDRYTGEGWVRTGGRTPLAETTLEYPLGPREVISQRVEVESRLPTVPVAWRPIGVGPDLAGRVSLTDSGDLVPSDPLSAGDTYRVTSAIPASYEALEGPAPAAYPAAIRERYLRLPEGTPDRVARRTAEITANASTPYGRAARIERWLEANREYSLDVTRPQENVADTFLFEMERGYCTYYATTMVVMLRSEGVPARLTTGYTTGQQVGEDEWVVRGLDAHSWVEVYFADLGWVAFDPTPSEPRERAEQDRIERARQNNVSSVDVPESRPDTDTSAGGPSDSPTTPAGGDASGSQNPLEFADLRNQSLGFNGTEVGATGGDGDGSAPGPALPSREDAVLGGVLLVGLLAGARRSGVDRWLKRSAQVAYQRRVNPETDVERAKARAEIVLGRRYRPRRAAETFREYLADIDASEPAHQLGEIYERAHYGGTVDADAADRAVELVGDLRAENAGARRSRGPIW